MKAFGFRAVLTALLISLHFVNANFHIAQSQNAEHPEAGVYSYVACPSNKWNCDCFGLGKSEAQVGIPDSTPLSKINYFTIPPGFCGTTYEMDFYKNSDGTWDFYVSGCNPGTKLGKCYANSAEHDCPLEGVSIYDQLVCYSSVCGS